MHYRLPLSSPYLTCHLRLTGGFKQVCILYERVLMLSREIIIIIINREEEREESSDFKGRTCDTTS